MCVTELNSALKATKCIHLNVDLDYILITGTEKKTELGPGS